MIRVCSFCSSSCTPVATYFSRCDSCGHGFRSYEGDPTEYHAIEYRKRFKRVSNEITDNGMITPSFHRVRKSICKSRIKLLKGLLQPEFNCLDIGAGGGTFAKLLSKEVKNVDCTEVDPNVASEIEKLGLKVSVGDFMTMSFDNKYDIVFAWHVAEHIPDIQAFVEKAMAITTRYLVLEVPTNRKIKEYFDGHYHHFSLTSFRLCLKDPRILWVREGIQSPSLLGVAIPDGNRDYETGDESSQRVYGKRVHPQNLWVTTGSGKLPSV